MTKKTTTANKRKICYILAYKSPDYTRTRTLLAALRQLDDVELFEAVNTVRDWRRYLQTTWRLLQVRLKQNPDVYILGFRGHEILWLVRLLTAGKPLIFDEFINMHNWLVNEHKKTTPNSLVARTTMLYMKFLLNRCQKILTDTSLHAHSSSQTYGVPLARYQPVYVGADEEIFNPGIASVTKPKNSTSSFTVFFYGNLLPLHGVEHILGAAKLLKNHSIIFQIIGGKGNPDRVREFRHNISSNKLSNVEYTPWVEFSHLPALIGKADLCLGGPFGNTPQSRLVITGKTFQFLAMRRPTVVGIIDEDNGFKNLGNCLLVKQGSTQALADAIEWTFSHPDQLEKIARRGRLLYEERFATAKITEVLERVISSVL